ncbi:hypothetical protein [Marilutibacter chinensis]|uniref:DUF2779 domain-containing protein n=1 Tax=Marilutibacter chinensis TaxID=2912247 RepID=A0ABS9HT39_9GAMM|nr:hypothetical protein [Lysobacter chinensis]MCF7222069.1 hypothetical protein [Lysobacter chinensis]
MAAVDRCEERRRRELWWIKFAWQYHPGYLPVCDQDPDQPKPPAPDVVISSSGRRYGIEISQLVPSAYPGFTNLQIHAAQRSYLAEAQRAYERANGDDLFANFSFRPGPLPALRPAVQEMTGLVEKFRPRPGESFRALPGQRKTADLLPRWLSGLSVFFQLPGLPRSWVGGSVWSTFELERGQVATRIGEKSRRLTEYRRYADEVWLLLVCDQVSIAADLSIPAEAVSWQFEHGFDRVLLMSMQEVLAF